MAPAAVATRTCCPRLEPCLWLESTNVGDEVTFNRFLVR
jgi:hypothetical protein